MKPTRRRFLAASAATATLAATAGCAALDEQQRRWIFQPSKDTWGGGSAAQGMDDVWLYFTSTDGDAVRLHGLWLPQPAADAPLMLYLHGARWNLASSAGRMRRMHALGFAVLGIDYRGFGRSTDALPSEDRAHEDALQGWRWLAARQPGAPRFVYGHSLGSAIALRLATEAGDRPAGVIVEGAFTSIPELVSTFRYGWLPVGPLISQRFDSAARIGRLQSPLVAVHGARDGLVPAELGQRLFARAPEPKRFVLVENGTHHNASGAGLDELRGALREVFGLPTSA